jgi:polyhydroxybutyrate depolymerase
MRSSVTPFLRGHVPVPFPAVRVRSTALLAVAVALSSAVAPARAAGPTRTSTVGLVVAGTERTYRLHASASAGRPQPLVVVLHGAGATAQEVERRYHWDPLADREGFAVAYPQGRSRRWDDRGSTDVAFLDAMLDDVAGRLTIDSGRVYVTGISNGGVMTYRAGCALARRVAAIGPVAAWIPDCAPATPVSVVHVHGLDDHVLGFGGGAGYPPVPEGLAAWRRADGCSDTDATQRQGEVTRVRWTACVPGVAVELDTIDTGQHEWPGAIPKPGNDPVSRALDATGTIWRFFRAHSRA